MTLRQIQALRKRRLEQIQREEFMLSQLTAVTANFSFCRPEQAFRPDHFMLHPLPPEQVETDPNATPGDALLKVLEGLPFGIVQRVN